MKPMDYLRVPVQSRNQIGFQFSQYQPTMNQKRAAKDCRRRMRLAADPHCRRCGCELQGDDPRENNYACVVNGAIHCRRCTNVLSNDGKVSIKRVIEKTLPDLDEVLRNLRPGGRAHLARRLLMVIDSRCSHCGRELSDRISARAEFRLRRPRGGKTELRALSEDSGRSLAR